MINKPPIADRVPCGSYIPSQSLCPGCLDPKEDSKPGRRLLAIMNTSRSYIRLLFGCIFLSLVKGSNASLRLDRGLSTCHKPVSN